MAKAKKTNKGTSAKNATKKTAKKTVKGKKVSKKTTPKTAVKKMGALGPKIREYLATCWSIEHGKWHTVPDYDKCVGIAKACKPDTAYNKNHHGWYKNDFKNRMLDAEVAAKEAAPKKVKKNKKLKK